MWERKRVLVSDNTDWYLTMKTLFEQLCDESTLKLACQRVIQKDARGGLDGVEPHDLENHLDQTVHQLIRELRERKYVPVPYAKSSMPKFNEANEWRKLSLPAVVDKVVQQGFVEVVGPIFEKEFLDCSYAYRRGKGPLKAIKRVEHILRSFPIQWVATMDIDDFFDTMSHDILLAQIAEKINEPELLNLVSLWLHAGIISQKGEWEESDEGIAQGSVVSPLFSNIYLHALDQFAVDHNYFYVRYSDNFILFSESKDNIYIVYEQVQSFIEDQVQLKLNENPYPFKHIDRGFTFLGIYFRGKLRRISSGKETKIFRKLNWLTDKTKNHNPFTFLNKLNESLDGIARYYSFVEPFEQFEMFDQHLLKRLRFLLMHFWQKELFSTQKEMNAFLKKIHFLRSRSTEDLDAFCSALTKEAHNDTASDTTKEPKSENRENTASQAKRAVAQKQRYLKKIADQTEVSISTPGIFVGKTGNRIMVRQQRKNIMEVPFQKIQNISINSEGVSFSSDLVFQCSQKKIPITFYSYKGMPYAVLQSPLHSMGTISVAQIKTYETEKALELVKKILTGKSKNQINLLKFYLRSRKNSHLEFPQKVNENLIQMNTILQNLQKFEFQLPYSIVRDRLFSAEGRISALYWDCMKLLISPELGFNKRQRYQAPDLVNQLLNYGYGILYQRTWQATLKAGLNPHISFLHAFQPNKPTLVYDLVEEFRQPFVDRPVFSLLTKGKKGSDLKVDSNSGLLEKNTRDQLIKAVLGRLSSLIVFRNKKVQCEEIIEIQTRNLVRFLEDKENYKSFIAGY